MKSVLILFCCLWAKAISSSAEESVCYSSIVSFCRKPDVSTLSCSACYGGFKGNTKEMLYDMQRFANSHIATSFDYLRIATNFGSYLKDRKGFEKLYRHLSDTAWEDGIDLMMFITKRGGAMDFFRKSEMKTEGPYNLTEIESLGRAVDIHKSLADQSFKIHSKAIQEYNHEPEVASYLENNFLHKHADIIRSLAGHVHDVRKMIANAQQKSVSLFLFDEYLQEHSL